MDLGGHSRSVAIDMASPGTSMRFQQMGCVFHLARHARVQQNTRQRQSNGITLEKIYLRRRQPGMGQQFMAQLVHHFRKRCLEIPAAIPKL